jgi:hypothetical protein
MAFNKDQWIDSFEGQMSILRPHLSERLLATLSMAAWHKHGTKGVDPIKAAREESALLDQQQGAKRPK